MQQITESVYWGQKSIKHKQNLRTKSILSAVVKQHKDYKIYAADVVVTYNWRFFQCKPPRKEVCVLAS